MVAPTIPENWEEVGDTSVDDCTSASSLVLGSLSPMIGMVVPVAWDTIPDEFLICDGSTYDRVDYPLLYDVLPSAFIIDADTFSVPDLSGKVVIGPSGSHFVGDVGGEETVTLSASEMPAHTHTEITAVASVAQTPVVPIPSAIPGIGITGSAGLGAAHNNLQPFSVLTYVIVAR